MIQRVVEGWSLVENSLPARVRIESFEQLCSSQGISRGARSLDAIVTTMRSRVLALEVWVTARPLIAIVHHDVWETQLARTGPNSFERDVVKKGANVK